MRGTTDILQIESSISSRITVAYCNNILINIDLICRIADFNHVPE
jgi:hypothetical protein